MEQVVEKALRRCGYRVYLAWYRKMLYPKGIGRPGAPSMRPLIDGCLFVQGWRGWPEDPITGVIGLMRGSGGEPAVMSDDDLDRFRRKEWAGEFDEPLPRAKRGIKPGLEVGQAVSLQNPAGPEADPIEAKIEDLSENGQAIIIAAMFGREVRTTVDQSALTVMAG